MGTTDIIHRHYHSDIKRWMIFVDGENFTIRAQEIAREQGKELFEGPYFQKDIFIWPSTRFQSEIVLDGAIKIPPIRSYYYTSTVGAEARLDEIRMMLWQIGFHAQVFKKTKGRKSKGVDITLTKDVLSHAFLDNYDLAVLVAGDADYIPLIEEVKRLGKLVYIAFHRNAKIPNDLILMADHFEPLDVEGL